MDKIIKTSFRTVINKILDSRKGKIIAVTHKFPEYELIQISSNGETLNKAKDEEKLIITFKTDLFRNKK